MANDERKFRNWECFLSTKSQSFDVYNEEALQKRHQTLHETRIVRTFGNSGIRPNHAIMLRFFSSSGTPLEKAVDHRSRSQLFAKGSSSTTTTTMNWQGDLTDLNKCMTSAKKRSWKKPKDKPKRPLSAYNIFFQYERTRIVAGDPEDMSGDEIVRSIEQIISKGTVKRRHRKTHGKISFRDLARQIADRWKRLDKATRSYFDTYAEVDMKRYKDQVEEWKKLKEEELCSALNAATQNASQVRNQQQQQLDLNHAQYNIMQANNQCYYHQSEGSEFLESGEHISMVHNRKFPPVLNQTCDTHDVSEKYSPISLKADFPTRLVSSGGGIEPIPLSEMNHSDGDEEVMTPLCGKLVHRLFGDDRSVENVVRSSNNNCHPSSEPAAMKLSDYCSIPDIGYSVAHTPPQFSSTVSAAVAIATPDTPESCNHLAKFLEHLDFSAL